MRRKRKRLRTRDAQEAEQVVSLEQAIDPQLHSGLIPEIAALPEPLTSSPALQGNQEYPRPEASSEDIITVERFLRCSAQITSKTKQAVPDGTSLRKSSAYSDHRPAERRTKRVRKVARAPKRPRESSRIAKTLFRAAVLADGDPLDALVDDAGISHTRRPLKFVPVNKFATPVETNSTEPSHLDQGDPAMRTRCHDHAPVLKQHQHTSRTRKPLCLVPLQEAEAAYSVIFP